jgi:hypothetical protein
VLSQVLCRFQTDDYARLHTPWEMRQVYNRSRIVFSKSIGGDVNMRVFEALAAGALLVTDRIGNGLDELQTEGEHYMGYDTAAEAVAQVERYLADEEARARIASAGQNIQRAARLRRSAGADPQGGTSRQRRALGTGTARLDRAAGTVARLIGAVARQLGRQGGGAHGRGPAAFGLCRPRGRTGTGRAARAAAGAGMTGRIRPAGDVSQR